MLEETLWVTLFSALPALTMACGSEATPAVMIGIMANPVPMLRTESTG